MSNFNRKEDSTQDRTNLRPEGENLIKLIGIMLDEFLKRNAPFDSTFKYICCEGMLKSKNSTIV